MDVVFVHGWGFDAGVWDTLVPQLHHVRVHTIDLGFFQTSDNIVPLLPAGAIYIGHSLGVMWLLQHLPKSPRGFVSINGFDCFKDHVPPATVLAMQKQLKRNPETLMHDFWANCAAPPPAIALDAYNLERLQEGLEWLKSWDESAALRTLACPVLALASSNDAIVPKPMSETIWKNHADLRWCETNSHILPLSNADWCAKHVQEFINAQS